MVCPCSGATQSDGSQAELNGSEHTIVSVSSITISLFQNAGFLTCLFPQTKNAANGVGSIHPYVVVPFNDGTDPIAAPVFISAFSTNLTSDEYYP
jgi:hypothetical protein